MARESTGEEEEEEEETRRVDRKTGVAGIELRSLGESGLEGSRPWNRSWIHDPHTPPQLLQESTTKEGILRRLEPRESISHATWMYSRLPNGDDIEKEVISVIFKKKKRNKKKKKKEVDFKIKNANRNPVRSSHEPIVATVEAGKHRRTRRHMGRRTPESAARDDKCTRQGFLEMEAEHPEGILSAAGGAVREGQRFGIQLASKSEGGEEETETRNVIRDRIVGLGFGKTGFDLPTKASSEAKGGENRFPPSCLYRHISTNTCPTWDTMSKLPPQPFEATRSKLPPESLGRRCTKRAVLERSKWRHEGIAALYDVALYEHTPIRTKVHNADPGYAYKTLSPCFREGDPLTLASEGPSQDRPDPGLLIGTGPAISIRVAMSVPQHFGCPMTNPGVCPAEGQPAAPIPASGLTFTTQLGGCAPIRTPERYWRLFNDLGLSPHGNAPASSVVSLDAFLNLSRQVQALTGMIQTVVPLIPQLVCLVSPQVPSPSMYVPEPLNDLPDDLATHERLWEEAGERLRGREATPEPSILDLCSANLPLPKPNTVSTDSADNSFKAQLSSRELRKAKGEVGDDAPGASPFTLKIQDKPVPLNFRLPALKAYDGGSDPTEYMALYGTSDALMYRAFPPILRGSTQMCLYLLIQTAREGHTAKTLHGRTPPRRSHSSSCTSPSRPEGYPRPTHPEMLQRANQYVAAKALVAGKREDSKRPWMDFAQATAPRSIPEPSRRRLDRLEPPCSRLPLNASRIEIFLQIQEKGLLREPNPVKATNKDRSKYYRFHRDYGHDTKDCRHLGRFLKKLRESSPRPKGPVEKQIDIIKFHPRNAYARSTITFGVEEAEFSDHDDALVISIRIANAKVKRVMLDLTDSDLSPIATALTGLTGESVGQVEDENGHGHLMVVDLPSTYNMILGHPTLNIIRAVVSTYHRAMKFPTSIGIRMRCYLTVVSTPKRTAPTHPQPMEQLIEIPLKADRPDQVVKVGTTLPEADQVQLIQTEASEVCPKMTASDRMVNKVFKSQLGRNMEVYVDDMIVKSKSTATHLTDLAETFRSLRRFNMCLNPAKCAFGVSSGKFLGFIVHQRGIDANPEKVRAIMEMQSPRLVKKVQCLTGKLAALGRFMSCSRDKCFSFFRALRRVDNFKWTPKCEEAFGKMKTYLEQLPQLTSPCSGEVLGLYLAASEQVVSSVLQIIYYTIHILARPEERYPPIENPKTPTLLLGPYDKSDIRPYAPRMAIKAQVLADFISELTPENSLTAQGTGPLAWALYIDGAGIIFKNPNRELMSTPPTTKPNMRRYCRDYVQNLEAFTDSQLLLARFDPDTLAQLASSRPPGELPKRTEILSAPTLPFSDVNTAEATPNWMEEILHYKERGELPDDPRTVLANVHEGICGEHIRDTQARILLTDATPRHFSLHTTIRQCPSPRTSSAHFPPLWANVNYFTKWVEVEPLAATITDNGTQFNNARFKAYYQSYGIRLKFSSVTNRAILEGLKKRVGEAHGAWVEELPSVLWAFRTTPKMDSGESPFGLVYRTETVLPLEIVFPTLRVESFNEETLELGHRVGLDLLDE
ncbi:Retrotransposon protein [Musa troglodytarum]|uniref:Retrotransposon protein n=1 Tax=Musa troglodytarum TaxID=320322 RepID=A0A9E7H2V2_9LILI|nr:Retrotransposon protein [Musa troglodytarum]